VNGSQAGDRRSSFTRPISGASDRPLAHDGALRALNSPFLRRFPEASHNQPGNYIGRY
jgi:hypothetical protein